MQDIVKTGREIQLEIKEVMPPQIYEWFEVIAKSLNTSPEFLMLSTIPTTGRASQPWPDYW